MQSRFAVVPVLCALCACASVSPRESISAVNALAAQRLGVDPGDASAVDSRLQRLLANELSADAAVEVALLRNPRLRATYEELGVAQADLVSAGLLKNPVLSGSLLFPLSAGGVLDVGGSVVEDFLDLFFLPLRKRLAGQQLTEAKLRVADAVLALAAEVRTAYFSAVAASQLVQLRQGIAQATSVAAALAEKQLQAGDIADLSAATQQVFAIEAEAEVLRSRADAAAASARLQALLGTSDALRLPSALPPVPVEPSAIDAPGAERLGLEQRLDLQAATAEVAALDVALELERKGRWLGALEVGASFNRDTEGEAALGPTLALQLPLFDQGQARLARLGARRRQSLERVAALRLEALAQIRTSYARFASMRELAGKFRELLIPLRVRIVQLSQVRYGAMLLGVYQLLLAKQAEVAAYSDSLLAARDYWIARSDLERAVGGRLPQDSPAHPVAPLEFK